jgi:small subunit ribosomal protein S9
VGATVNGLPVAEYFPTHATVSHALAPLHLTGQLDAFTVEAVATGGGYSGQAGAVRLALARALQAYEPQWRLILRNAGYLTVDSRQVERKKPGQPKARKRSQWSKR